MKVFSVRLWDRTGKLIRTFIGHDNPVRKVVCSADGRFLASGSWLDIKLWDVRTGNLIRTLKHDTDVVNALAFAPSGTRLASAGLDGLVKLWDVSTGDEIITLDGHRSAVSCLTFSPNGRILASAHEDDTIRLWQAATAEEVRLNSSSP
jgi:WD40 repeat protein